MLIKSVKQIFDFKSQLRKGTDVEVFLWARWCQGKVVRLTKKGTVYVRITEFNPIRVEGAFESSDVRPMGGWALKVSKPNEKNVVGT